ncbi:MAG TPA: hydroxymethylglutaryl-CoA reductase, degradative [Polyangia bacterium]|jgi:hydroxymethylglutaryl-CoA reductase|nr:hydroxymethylglutaryl-CoA reductase, degradative [Polyangia bacterium]
MEPSKGSKPPATGRGEQSSPAPHAISTSRIPGFYRLSVDERRQILRLRADLSEEDMRTLDGGGIDTAVADRVVENAVGVYALPLGVGLNFVINGRDVLVPMAVEEPSVIAAASNAARMVRDGGGFVADADDPVMTAQIEIVGVDDPDAAKARLEAACGDLLALAHATLPRLADRGGGARELEVRTLPGRVIVHVHIDCRDAMGANMVNTVAEALAEKVARLARGRSGLRILTNLCDRRRVRVKARVPAGALATETLDGAAVRDGIVAASRFAEDDPYRAATHNKGIMNGVDAVVIATGNDWRGVEAGAHAFAAAEGRYRPLAVWRQENGDLVGQLEMPMAVGTVGGTLHAHAGARLAQKLLGVTDAKLLAMIVGSAGLASNLAALRALATEGIQRGHMALHRKSQPVAVLEPPQAEGGRT